jgi:hypothetical protein
VHDLTVHDLTGARPDEASRRDPMTGPPALT